MTRHAISYKAALQWMIDNDDTYWLENDKPIMSVTAEFCADIYGRSGEEIISDLKALINKPSNS